MSFGKWTIGTMALACALPSFAQQRGSVEFGAFGSAASFDKELSLKSAFGGGGRVGVYLTPRWSIEFEDAEMRASRPNGLTDVNVGILSGRLVAVPVKSRALSLLVGAGAGVSTETNFLHSYGVDALVGAKVRLSENVALRVDGVWDWLANEDWKSYQSVRVGLTFYRHPSRAAAMPAPAVSMRAADSVSAQETRRLRDRDMALTALRDSLRVVSAHAALPPAVPPTMDSHIHFAFDKSTLSDSAITILNANVPLFRAHPDMTISIQGYTDAKGTDRYNMALGQRRAQAAKDYLVSQGIEASRVTTQSRGEREQIAHASVTQSAGSNRRAVFQFVIASDHER